MLTRWRKERRERAVRRQFDDHIYDALANVLHASCLDYSAGSGELAEDLNIMRHAYNGIERDTAAAAKGRAKGYNILAGDINNGLPFDDASFHSVFGLSAPERLTDVGRFLRECLRVLRPGAALVLVTGEPAVQQHLNSLGMETQARRFGDQTVVAARKPTGQPAS